MDGLMQDAPLTINSIFQRGEQYYGAKTIATRTVTGIDHTTFAEWAVATRKMAGVLESLGLSSDARVGTFAWNSASHLQAYYAVPCTGRILHTINIRYFPEHVTYSVNHAEDEAIFVENSLLPLFSKYLASFETVKHVIVLDDGGGNELPDDSRVISYADAVSRADEIDLTDRVQNERQAAALCYTTGTTGNPKGVLYSHRSNWLHANATLNAATLALTERDTMLPVVPMFHANAWGYAYSTVLAGASIVMPGPDLTPKGILSLIESEKVTLSAGVPTIWMGMVPLLKDFDLSSLREVLCGGSAVPKFLSEQWREAIGLPITQGWGMTETSPVGSVSSLRSIFDDYTDDQKADIRATAGIALPGFEMRIVDEETREPQPWNDEATGELEVRGAWVASQYYRTDEPGEQFSPDGWLRTGDVAAISEYGYMRLVDRTKDLVKSGGEWISSVDLENQIMAHPSVAEAAVIALPHPKWMERPFACVVLKPGEQLQPQDIIDFLAKTVDKWQLPDEVVFVDEIPKTSVGKFSKKTLREQFKDHVLPTA
ncbi:fatty-acyl-CoA synthase [Frankineae bacterium MT45]|nr:fatty-acyl-CoA synthase [Frankineae bacterium MT45]